MSAPTCGKPGCAAVPTIREDIRSMPRIFGPMGIKRYYLLCERHDDDYFAGHDWLDDKRCARIKQDLIPGASS